MTTKSRFASSDPLPLRPTLRLEFAHRGLPENTYGWIVDALLDTGCLPDDHDAVEGVHQLCLSAFHAWKHFENAPLTVIKFALAIEGSRLGGVHLCRSTRGCIEISIEAAARFVKACGTQSLDFTSCFSSDAFRDELKGMSPGNALRHQLALARWLGGHGLLQPERLCEMGQLDHIGSTFGWRGGQTIVSAEVETQAADIKSPAFWVIMGEKYFWPMLSTCLSEANDEAACRITCGIVATISCLSRTMITGLFDLGQGREILRHLFDDLDRRVGIDPRRATEDLRRTWLRLALELRGGNLEMLPEEVRGRLKSGADFEMGRLRILLRDSADPKAAEKFTELRPVYDAAINTLLELCPLWDAMRPLLLALRELRVPSVAADMRYWTDSWRTQVAPEPWCWVPQELVSGFHALASREQEQDRELSGLRSRFAKYCLEKLKPRDADRRPLEPNDDWRWAYIRAARELRVNPEGNGHRILHQVAANDPDPGVREEAKAAYNEFRHGPGIPVGMSPRRVVTNAFIWLFQAHFLSTNPSDVVMDLPGVQRTREEIARRTTEPEWEKRGASPSR